MAGVPFDRKATPLRELSTMHIGLGGCGTSLPEVRKRFGIEPDDTAGLLDAFGETLMMTGGACLPGPTKANPKSMYEEARTWTTLTAEEQLEKLRYLMGMFTTPPPWRDSQDGPSEDKPMLPVEMGLWDGRRPLPSCFGMLVILASYGYYAGAPMLTASVQRMSAEPVTTGLQKLFGEAHDIIADRLPLAFRVDRLPRALRDCVAEAEGSMRLMLTRREFHGAIVIRLKDGRWVSMDPYMRNMAVLNAGTHTAERSAAMVLSNPVTAVTLLGQRGWSAERRLSNDLTAVKGLLELTQTGTVLHKDVPLTALSGIILSMLAKHTNLELSSEHGLVRNALGVSGDTEPETAWAMLRSMQYGSQHEMLRERLLLGLFDDWAQNVWRAAQRTRSNEPHYAMMLSSSRRSLAVWGLINLRHRMRRPVRALDLLPYSASDITLYNALCDLPHGQPTETDLHWIEERTQKFSEVPPYLLHPLVLQALNRQGVRYVQEA